MQSMKEKEIDLVVANTIECFFAVEAAKQLGIKAIWAIHESVDCFQYFSSLNWKIQQSYLNCYGYVYLNSSLIFFVSFPSEAAAISTKIFPCLDNPFAISSICKGAIMI